MNENTTRHLNTSLNEITLTEFLIQGILLNIVGILGLLGNVISIFILTKPQMKNSINCILVGLASSDCLLIVTSICMFGLSSAGKYETLFSSYYKLRIFPYIIPYVYPIGMIAQTGSVYLTLCVTMERYVAVCRPLKASSICTHGRAKLYVIRVAVFACIYNIPRFFEITTAFDSYTNRTVMAPTPLRTNGLYVQFYIAWMYVIFMYIFPFASLAFLNLSIYRTVRSANTERAILSKQQKRDIGLATMLMIVVLVFFLCNILALVVNILEVSGLEISELTQTSNLLVTLNSSINFVIYCIFSDKFQRIFRSIFFRKHRPKNIGEGLNNQRMIELDSFTQSHKRQRNVPLIYVSDYREESFSNNNSDQNVTNIRRHSTCGESRKIFFNNLFKENTYYSSTPFIQVIGIPKESHSKQRMLPGYRK